MAALYNKYRPRKLAQVLGQEHIKRILESQIDKDDMSHAYLFTGPSGTGKTTVARIIAASVNCSSGQTSNPSANDKFVELIVKGSNGAVDVVELDAATNNSIDHIREIRNKLEYAPSMMRKKIFIIDECHRLSSAAWEGLLKMLEEPPEYAIFILCTTEPEKVTETVKTRCMTFDFRSLSQKDIRFYLSKIAGSEKIQMEDSALDLLSTSANGSLRLGISRLEKFKHLGTKITAEEVAQAAGVPCGASARNFLRAVIVRDFLTALQASSSMISVGIGAPEYILGLANLCHDLLVCGPKSPYKIEDHGYTADEASDVMALRNEIMGHISNEGFRALVRKWIQKLNEHYQMTVYNLQPQFQVNYTFVDLYEIFRMHLSGYPREV